jgi:hypothetical protein
MASERERVENFERSLFSDETCLQLKSSTAVSIASTPFTETHESAFTRCGVSEEM